MNTNDSKKLAVVTFFMICLCIIYTSVSQATETISDDFTGPTLNTQLWQAFSHDHQQWFVQQGGELIIQPTQNFNSGVNGNCWLTGNFDMRVEYRLINFNWSNVGFLKFGF